MAKPDRAATILAYQLAFEAANPGSRAQVEYVRGWYLVKTSAHMPASRYRHATLLEMTERLRARVQ